MRHLKPFAAIAVLTLMAAPSASARDRLDKINRYAVALEQDGVEVAVSWKLALHSDGEFVPLIVRVVNTGKGTANVDLENFKLVDSEGDAYRAADYRDVLTVHRDLGRDKRMLRQLDYGGLNTGPQRFVPSAFYPHEQGTQDSTTELLTMSQMIDMVYFHVPKRMKGEKLTLVIDGIIDAPAFRLPFSID